jgi:uncharacterized protein
MIAAVVNAIAVLAGSLIGLLLHKKLKEELRNVVFQGAGLISLAIGIGMSLQSGKIVYLALSIIMGGLLGEWWKIEDGVLHLGEFLKRTFAKGEDGKGFAYAFLDSSVLFCVGAMALVGSFRAGTEGNYDLIFTKSVMDGFMAVVLTAAMGIGVVFSSITVLVYQGLLTLLAQWVKPLVSDLLLKEISGTGGLLVIAIGINLLGMAKIKTANFLPALLLMVAFIALDGLLFAAPV